VISYKLDFNILLLKYKAYK